MIFQTLPLHQLLIGVPTDFDLYLIYSNNKEVLFSAKGHIFSTQKKKHLLDKENSFIYFKEEDYEKVKQYKAKHLVTLLKNPELNSDERAELLHGSISDQMQEMFEYGVNETAIVRSKAYVQAMIGEMMSNRIRSESLLQIVSHDYKTYTHSINVCIYALALAKELACSQTSMYQIGMGGLLHDLGKTKISSAIINKPGKLTFDEYEEMKHHPNFGCSILLAMGESDQTILDIVRNHHEKLDGSGYAGMTSEAIPSEIQIVTVADIFDALSTNRSYKLAATHFTSFKTMKIAMKEQINMEYVNQLIKLMGK